METSADIINEIIDELKLDDFDRKHIVCLINEYAYAFHCEVKSPKFTGSIADVEMRRG